ncbi:MAG: acyl-[Eubacterium sp.]|nr:acyl-[acyl-carrier-protein] thioesterase [Eubacterium sp.]
MYSFDTRVRFSEITENKKMSLVAIINCFQDCCTYEAEDGGVGLDWFDTHHSTWMLVNWQIKIKKYPVFCQNIKVTTWACGFRAFIGKRNFTIEDRETGELLVYAYSEWAYVNTEKNRPERNVPEKELNVYGMKEPLQMDFETGKIEVPQLEADDSATLLNPITVTRTDIDTNHHVNNGKYIELAMSVLPDDIRINGFRAEYKQQSVLGDTLYPKVYSYSDRRLVILYDENSNPKLIAEFLL